MSRALTASERDALTRLAASLPKGSAERRAILAGLLETVSKTAKNTSMNFIEAHMKEAAEDVLSKFRGVVVSPYLTVIGDRWNIALTVRTSLFRDFKLMFRGKSDIFMDEGETIQGLLSRAFGAKLSWRETTAEGYLFYLEAANTVDYVEEFIRETVKDAVWDVNSSAKINVSLYDRIWIVVKTDTLNENWRANNHGRDFDTEEGEALVKVLTDALRTKVRWDGTDSESYSFVARL